MQGQRIGYVRVSTIEQNTGRQLADVPLDKKFIDRVSGKNMERPQLEAMLLHVREGDTVLVHSLDRLARNLEDLRRIVSGLTARGVRVEFLKESLVFTGEDSAMSKLLLSLLGCLSEFERANLLERQREGIAIAKAAGKYRGGQFKLKAHQVEALKQKVNLGVPIAAVAREYKLSRQSVYSYLQARAESVQ